ncbi:MAG: hypothetical protein EU530_00425 [Promethearchaeota archaeon]|nr:MAG: hypothetical protein EU530_00425 [Candidatus Lokiarchaeota archaeon]
MGKRENYRSELTPILNDQESLSQFLIQHSNLPGRRANLELIHAFADVNKNLTSVMKWTKFSEEDANVNDPTAFLVFCAAVSLGQIYTETRDEKILLRLKEMANDTRWRVRECVAFGFQRIGEHEFTLLKKIFSDWLHGANNYERRCILVALAHPDFLNEERANYCIEITNKILEELNPVEDESFRVLKKGLDFTISVYVSAAPTVGFMFMNSWIGKNRIVDSVLKTNLLKNRLAKHYPQKVSLLLDFLEVK